MTIQPARGRHFRSSAAGGARSVADAGVESNSRLTAMTAVVLLVMLAAEGLTLLRIHQAINYHVFIGMLLVPPVLLKIGSTGWRFFRYYGGSPAYTRKGPPPIVLRVLGPFTVLLSVILLASGIGLIAAPSSWQSKLLLLHKASFVLWFGVMTIHVLGHILETAHLAPKDLTRRTRRRVAHAGLRMWALALSVAAGVILGVVTWGHNGGYNVAHFGIGH